MSLHFQDVNEPWRAVCNRNAARLTDRPDHDGLNCDGCEAIIRSAQLPTPKPKPKHAARPPHKNTMAGR